jgi:[acyl-carrier-protein] S-malonyltransferase
MPTDPEAIKLALVKQLYSPVRWTETVEYMAAQGVSQVYEIGPGKVLCGLIKRIDKTLSCEALNTLDTLQS